eukprot:TRINITY_DN43870_c0_g2_i1.p1 TRINITY_DN43870_c0_g2~~TRINITY_DN43870_c0_g2_i1.p1  ORF type:complete len:577 (-),score=93.11 TRINITY_DN43870_c0_g2_i1:117-1847(-)
MSVNLQDGSGDVAPDLPVAVSKAVTGHRATWSVHVPARNSPVEIPSTKNHTATLVGSDVYVFGGYDGQKNHNDLFAFGIHDREWRQLHVQGARPNGRNGHSATLLYGGQQILILGGWLGNGPLAAGDVHLLNLHPLRWAQPDYSGEPPGPCNMHTADLVGRQLLVFRGGDGRAYLNDLHGLDLDTNAWYSVKTSGEKPPPRANHASAVDEYQLYIFGGWDGTKRLNDLYVLDTRDMVWSMLRPAGCAPAARAGMTLSLIRDCLYLFGGSGHTTRCFNDVHVYDPKDQSWSLCITTASEPSAAPERCAGHVAVVVDRRLLISGGACGTHYYGKGKWFILDTDAPPTLQVDSPSLCADSVRHVMTEYFNCEQFSDVVFVVEGRRLYAHRILLTLFSDYFRRAFACGMRESFEPEVHIEDVPYDTFYALLEYLYTGQLRLTSAQLTDTCFLLNVLRAADQFCVDAVKSMCEQHLSALCTAENMDGLLQEARRFQAHQLRTHCEWFKRQQQFEFAHPHMASESCGADCGACFDEDAIVSTRPSEESAWSGILGLREADGGAAAAGRDDLSHAQAAAGYAP